MFEGYTFVCISKTWKKKLVTWPPLHAVKCHSSAKVCISRGLNARSIRRPAYQFSKQLVDKCWWKFSVKKRRRKLALFFCNNEIKRLLRTMNILTPILRSMGMNTLLPVTGFWRGAGIWVSSQVVWDSSQSAFPSWPLYRLPAHKQHII